MDIDNSAVFSITFGNPILEGTSDVISTKRILCENIRQLRTHTDQDPSLRGGGSEGVITNSLPSFYNHLTLLGARGPTRDLVFGLNSEKMIYRCRCLSKSSKLQLDQTQELDKIIITKHSPDVVRDNQSSNKKTCTTKLKRCWKLVKQVLNKKE